MAISHSTRIPAVGYLRRSTRKQEKSIADQKRAIERWVDEHGYRIIRWYIDDGISGDSTEQRADFLRMRADAKRGEFEAVVCWDQDRFGRFDSLDAGYWIKPFRDAGVTLVTLDDGPINWNDFAGRLMYNIKQEGKHQFLRDLSRNTARGQITNAMNGYLCGQAAPYGYDRMLVDESGKHRQRVRIGEQTAKPRSWHVTLVLSEDPERVDTAKWLFRTYAETDIGLRSMANDLNRRGVPGPGGGAWWIGTIREILKRPVYAGDFIWPQRRMGKYHRVAGTEVKERDPSERRANGQPLVRDNPESEQIVIRDAFPALIDRETFARIQAKLAERKGRTTSHKTKNGDRYILTGLLHCAHCGAKMYGTKKTRQKNGKKYQWEKYICSTYHTQGKSRCGCHSVDQGKLLSFLLQKLRDAVLAGGHREELRTRVLERLSTRSTSDEGQIEALQAKVTGLDKEIQHGTRRLLRAPDNIADLLADELSNMKRERDRLAAELQQLEASPAPVDLEAEADAVVDKLWTLAEELQNAEPARLRELIRRMVARIDLWFDHVPKGNRVECPLSRGMIELRPDQISYRLVSRGDWI
jgi:site-specific DNA recombinase